jgi:hypothetical protein
MASQIDKLAAHKLRPCDLLNLEMILPINTS